MTIEDNTALVRRLFEALNRGIADVNALRPDAFASDEVFHVAGHPLDYVAHAAFDTMLFAAFPDLHTGRFAGASGSFRVERLLNLATGVTSGTIDGDIVIP